MEATTGRDQLPPVSSPIVEPIVLEPCQVAFLDNRSRFPGYAWQPGLDDTVVLGPTERANERATCAPQPARLLDFAPGDKGIERDHASGVATP